jgi:hypothetical protein
VACVCGFTIAILQREKKKGGEKINRKGDGGG